MDILLESMGTVIAAALGAVGTIWSYFIGRKTRVSEESQKRSEAIRELNETIDLQCTKINDLYELVLKLRDENAELLASQSELRREVESLRKELNKYKKKNG